MDEQFAELKNDTILRAVRGERVPYVPVWVMRQAGRYLPEFQEVRKHHDFFEICRTPELACELTLQPIRRFNLDAAVIFSDILVVPQALGMHVKMVSGTGPVFPTPLISPENISLLNSNVNVEKELDYVYKAITLTRHNLEGKVPLIGFSGAPFTLMCYMIEGSSSKTMSKAKKWLYQYPYDSHQLLDLLTKAVTNHLVCQVKAGAQMLQVFDTNAGYLGPKQFSQFCFPYLKKISEDVRNKLNELNIPLVPMTVFAKDAHYAIEQLSECYDVISIDWTIDPKKARSQCGQSVTLQGNLDPCALYCDADDLDESVKEMIESFGTNRYIANLGHGIYPDVKPENMAVFVDAVHKHSRKLIQ